MGSKTPVREFNAKINHVKLLQAGQFMTELKDVAISKSTGTFDSAATSEYISGSLNQGIGNIPTNLQVLFDEVGSEGQTKISRFILDSANHYERQHGKQAPPDLMHAAFNAAYAVTSEGRQKIFNSGILLPNGKHIDKATFDSVFDDTATNAHSANTALQPNRATVAILSTLNDPCPWAYYLPTDIGSNQSLTAILNHQPAIAKGSYVTNTLLDGAFAGKPFLTNAVRNTTTCVASGNVANVSFLSSATSLSGNLSQLYNPTYNNGIDTCIVPGSNASDGTVARYVPLIRGRSKLYVNGALWGGESTNVTTNSTLETATGTNTFSGSGLINGVIYVLTGTITTSTASAATGGAYSLNITNSVGGAVSLPAGTTVTVEGYIDYETDNTFIPSLFASAAIYTLYAKPWQGYTTFKMGSRTQMSNELGLDPYSESLLALQNQITAERHNEALQKGWLIGSQNTITFNFQWTTGINEGQVKTRAMIVQDMAAPLSALSQQMAINTLSYGIGYLYVDAYIKGIFESLPSELWESSGVADRPGIFRVGRLFGKYEVYYDPNIIPNYNSGTSQILCVGAAPDVTRSPVIFGDAVPPVVMPIGVATDMTQGATFYARNFTELNPHNPSSLGFAILQVTNMGL